MRLHPILARDVAIRGCFGGKVNVKPSTHSPLYLTADAMEQSIKDLFLALLRELPIESIFYDVGANIGLYTWSAAGVRDDLKIISFEPDPDNFRLLTRTARAWGCPLVYMRQLGLNDVCGSVTF